MKGDGWIRYDTALSTTIYPCHLAAEHNMKKEKNLIISTCMWVETTTEHRWIHRRDRAQIPDTIAHKTSQFNTYFDFNDFVVYF